MIEASAAAEYLLRTPLGLTLAEIMEQACLLAPELWDVEVVSGLRRAVVRQTLAEHRAVLALDDLINGPVDRMPHTALVREAWPHRHTVSASDAFSVAVARASDIPLLTAEGPLTCAPALGMVVHNVRMG